MRKLALILFSLLICKPGGSIGLMQEKSDSPLIPVATNLFEFHSSFWVNLHHFLYLQAQSRINMPGNRRVAGIGAEMESLAQLPAEDHRKWETVLDYYEKNLASLRLYLDEPIIRITNTIAKQESSPKLPADGLDPGLKQMLENVADIYRTRWWPQHDRANRDWVKMMDPFLKSYGSSLAQRVVKVYQTEWPKRPFRVDVCAYAIDVGAYTVNNPDRITIGSKAPGNEGTQGLETLFHESLHILETRLVEQLSQQFRVQGKNEPSQLSHSIIFFTAGELTRQIVPGHKPYAVVNGLWERQPFKPYKQPLDRHWQLYLDGKVDFEAAIKSLVLVF